MSKESLTESGGSGDVKDAKTSLNEAPNWQANMKSIQETYFYLVNNDILSDVYLIVGKNDEDMMEIPAHKFVLSSRSPVFNQLFHGLLATKSDKVEIPDIDPTGFLVFLKYVYCDANEVDGDTVLSVLYASKKYDVPALQSLCVEFLVKSLESNNAFSLLTQAINFDESLLMEKCLLFIDENASDSFAAESFLDINLECLCLVLGRDTLIITEFLLFDTVMKWVVHKCAQKGISPTPQNKRIVLGKALYKIRFPLMTSEELANIPEEVNPLTTEEYSTLLRFRWANEKPTILFPDQPRHQRVRVYGDVNRQATALGSYFTLTVDRRICLHALDLFGPAVVAGASTEAEYDVSISLQLNRSYAPYSEVPTSVPSKKYISKNGNFKVYFDTHVEIQPGLEYRLIVTVKGPAHRGYDTCYFSPSAKVENTTFTFGTSSGGGQVSGITFSVS